MAAIRYKEIKEINTCTPHYISNEKGLFSCMREKFKEGFYHQKAKNTEITEQNVDKQDIKNTEITKQGVGKQQSTINNWYNNQEMKNINFGNNVTSSSQTNKNSKISDESIEKGLIIAGLSLSIIGSLLGSLFKRGTIYIIVKKLLKNK